MLFFKKLFFKPKSDSEKDSSSSGSVLSRVTMENGVPMVGGKPLRSVDGLRGTIFGDKRNYHPRPGKFIMRSGCHNTKDS